MTREDLYEQVWTEPMSRLAPRYGLSDVGLAKICKKHSTPRPPRGYWARLQYGKQVKRTALPALADNSLETVVMNPIHSPGRSFGSAPDLDKFLVVVSPSLSEPHVLVERTLSALEKASPDQQGIVRPRTARILDVSLTQGTAARAMCILDALIKAVESRGGKVAVTANDHKHETVAEIDGEAIPFCLTEELDREERDLTPAEEKEKKNWPWKYRGPVYRHSPTGRLVLRASIDVGYGHRRRWADGKRSRLEDHLPAFIAALHQFAEQLKVRRLEQEERRRRHDEWARTRAEKLRIIREEEQRLNGLLAAVDAWRRSQELRAYIRDVVQRVGAAQDSTMPDEALQSWVSWATMHADRLDPLLEGPRCILDEKRKWESSYPD